MAKYALVIANNDYTDPGLAQLTAPGQDAEDFARVLQAAHIGAFDEVIPVINQPEPVVREAIDRFFQLKKSDDLLILYFSGHGVRDEQGALYLALKNTRLGLLRSTALRSDFVRESMDQSRSRRQVLILDCCNSGAFAQGTKAAVGVSIGTGAAFEGSGYGRVVLTATDSTQFAWEGERVIGSSETKNSLFTHFLVKGLQGEADTDGDGRISVDELYDYAYEQIVSRTPAQTPGKWSYKQQGEIILCQGSPREILPAALPVDLQNAIQSSYASFREAAVHQLEELLKGRNIALARSARAALEGIAAEDDSYHVRSLAGQVLEPILQAEREKAARQLAEQQAAEQAEHEQAERAAREKADQAAVQIELARSQAAEKEKADQAARELARRQAQEKTARELAEKQAAEKAERERAEQIQLEKQQAADKAAREKAERVAAEKTALELTEKVKREQTVKEKAERSALKAERPPQPAQNTARDVQTNTQPLPGWRAAFWMAIGWPIGFLIPALFANAFLPSNVDNQPIRLFLLVFTLPLIGLWTAAILRANRLITRRRNFVAILLGYALPALIIFFIGVQVSPLLPYLSGRNPVLMLDLAAGGAVTGLFLALVLRQEKAISSRASLLWITLGHAAGFALSLGLLKFYIQYISNSQLGYFTPTLLLTGLISGLFCVAVLFDELRQMDSRPRKARQIINDKVSQSTPWFILIWAAAFSISRFGITSHGSQFLFGKNFNIYDPGGLLGGLAVAAFFWKKAAISSWKSPLLILVGYSTGLLYAYDIINQVILSTITNPAGTLIANIMGGAAAGAIGGLATALALRFDHAITGWKSVLWIILGNMLGFALGFSSTDFTNSLIFRLISPFSFDFSTSNFLTTITIWPVAGAITGLICGLVTLWQLRAAQNSRVGK
jgi:hypothetical protein